MTNEKGDNRKQKGDKPDTVTNNNGDKTRRETTGSKRETRRTQ